MARRNYTLELRHMLFWGTFAGMFEGSVSAIVAAKTFHAGPWLIAFVTSTPMFSNLLGLIWGSIASGRRKVPLFVALCLGTAFMIGSVGLTPATPAGGFIFAAQILMSRVLLSGCMTVRASLWKHNYPTVERGRIAARLQFVRFSAGIATVLTASLLFDVDPGVYVFVYPIAALLGCCAALVVRRMHVRGEAAELKEIAAQKAADRGHTAAPWLEPFRAAIGVFREDSAYARYCTAMMFLGAANMMVVPIIAIMITKQLVLSYFYSCSLMDVVPRVLMMGSLLPWAGMFDRVGAVRFRVVNAMLWTSGGLAGGIAACVIAYTDYQHSAAFFGLAVVLVALSRVGHGLGMGGGAIAWNIGHLHFADPTKAEIYMGTHVFLAGIRGTIAPFLGTLLYTLHGPLAFLVSVALGVTGILIFVSLAKDERRRNEAENESRQAELRAAGSGS